MFTANVYRVMLASPSDVTEEREAARQIILDWNNQHAAHRKIILLPLGWEWNTTPTVGNHPQDSIDEQVLRQADLLVGIFWTRIGSSTGSSVSGTVHEIEEHIKAGKPAMLYFSEKATPPHAVDQEQYKGVSELQEEYRGKSLYFTFSSTQEFKDHFQRHLAMKMNGGEFGGFALEIYNGGTVEMEPPLSEQAITLLMEASNDSSGEIISVGHKGGKTIQTNSIDFTKNVDRRIQALWEAALEQLNNAGYIQSAGYPDEIYHLTAKGYEIADKLKEANARI